MKYLFLHVLVWWLFIGHTLQQEARAIEKWLALDHNVKNLTYDLASTT
jgi:hypothetical protein